MTQDNPDRPPEQKKNPDPTWEGEEIDRIFDEINRFGFHPKEE